MIPVKNERFVPCGQCHACRVNRKRKVIGQLLLEALYSENNSTFATLTYNDQHYPSDGSLRPDHILSFINRLRKPEALGPIRWFAVGEYGDKTDRAHYHMAIFNRSPEGIEGTVQRLWSKSKSIIGFTKCSYITPESISYIAGYCLKKMGRNDSRLEGRYPEFNRRSKYPPLGAAGIEAIIDTLYTRTGAASMAKSGDVPTDFRYQGRTYPISDYWRKHMREEFGIPGNPNPPPWEVDLPGFLQELDNAEKKNQKREYLDKRSTSRTI